MTEKTFSQDEKISMDLFNISSLHENLDER